MSRRKGKRAEQIGERVTKEEKKGEKKRIRKKKKEKNYNDFRTPKLQQEKMTEEMTANVEREGKRMMIMEWEKKGKKRKTRESRDEI